MDKYLKRPNTDNPKQSGKVRRYDENNIAFGFIENSCGKPMCVVCLQVLANESMKPAKLKLHLLTKHPEYSDKSKEFFVRKVEEYIHQRSKLTNLATTSERAQKASFLVAQQIAKCKKPHTIAQELILPAAVGMCEIMLGTEAANKLKSIPLSDDTVKRRIDDLSDDIVSQLLGRLCCSEVQFSIQNQLMWLAQHS